MTKDAGFQDVGLIAEKKARGRQLAESTQTKEIAPMAMSAAAEPATTRATSTSRPSWTWCWCS